MCVFTHILQQTFPPPMSQHSMEREKQSHYWWSQYWQVSENASWKSIWTHIKLCHLTVENSIDALYSHSLVASPIFFLVSFCFCFFVFLSPSLPSPSSLHLSSARPELGGRKTEKRKSEKEREEREIGFPSHIGSLEWSLKPQSVLALDKEAGFNKYVD